MFNARNRKFLVYKERYGRTHLHTADCHFKAIPERNSCNCSLMLAEKSVDSLIEKLQVLFRDMVRSVEWNPVFYTGNPAAGLLLKRHLKNGTDHIFVHLTGDRASDLGQLTLKRVFWENSFITQSKNVVVFNSKDESICSVIYLQNYITFAETIVVDLTCDYLFRLLVKDKSAYNVAITTTSGAINDESICSVIYLQNYITFAETIVVDLTCGYLFRLLVKDKSAKHISEKQVTATVILVRKKSHLKAINLYDGELAHSPRRGCAIALRPLRLIDTSINQHNYWAGL
ncbi:hypothetical protein MAR_012073 [Mya arenaria]|uniref:ALOG domain-containing protein n=1 Tax=Mya arenaria TaxID=6604 RepID=A0ABY7FYJ9_MYAAR|nr:hypothetical protein MAR_012073 [Mya arenaria]